MRTADTVDVRPKQEAANPIANVGAFASDR